MEVQLCVYLFEIKFTSLNITHILSFVANVRAQREAWIIGNQFLRSIYHVYPEMRVRAMTEDR